MSLREKLEATPFKGNLHGPIDCTVDHPDWPAQVFVRKMFGADRRKYDAYGFEVTGGKELEEGDDAERVKRLWALKPFLVCLCLAGADGARLFADGDESWIQDNLPGDVITKVSDEAGEFNGLFVGAVAQEQKNSGSGTPSGS